MIKLNFLQVLQELCKATGKWGIYVQNNTKYNFDEESSTSRKIINSTLKAAPYLNEEDDYYIICRGHGYILFDSEEECVRTFERTNGDEPGKLNPYRGKGNVYASIVAPSGEEMNTNT